MNALITELVLLQLALPHALVLAHAVLAPASILGLVLRFVGIAALLVYLALIGVWLFPPWWTPWALALLHVLATVRAYHLLATRARAPARFRRVVETVSGTVVTALMLILLVPAVAGHRAPSEAVVLSAPLEAGAYLVTSGGTNATVNDHLMTLTGKRYAPWRGQSHALDLIAIDRWGQRTIGLSPVEPSRYLIYGRRVLAPCDGTVRRAFDDAPDMPVPTMDREHMLGNHVILRCGEVHVVLAHLASGTVRVSPGEAVATGETLGRAGNSGNSAEPHLHLHVQRGLPPDSPISGEPSWFTIDGRFLVRGDILRVP